MPADAGIFYVPFTEVFLVLFPFEIRSFIHIFAPVIVNPSQLVYKTICIRKSFFNISDYLICKNVTVFTNSSDEFMEFCYRAQKHASLSNTLCLRPLERGPRY